MYVSIYKFLKFYLYMCYFTNIQYNPQDGIFQILMLIEAI